MRLIGIAFVSSVVWPTNLLPQSTPQHATAKPKLAAAPTSSEELLRQKLAAARDAQQSRDPQAIAQANRELLAVAFRELAQLRLLETAYSQSAELYQRALSFDDNAETRVDLAINELQAGRRDEAIAQATTVLTRDARNARAYNVRGRALAGKGDYAPAAQDLARAAELAPDIDTYYSLAICLLQSSDAKDKARAPEVFQAMKSLAGESGSLHVLFGRAYRDAGDMPAAIREFQKAIALDPRTPHAHYFLALAHLAVNEWKPTADTQSEFQAELKVNPRDYLANYMVGFTASTERNYAVSDRYLKIAAEVNPAWPEPPLYLGLNAYAQGDTKTAEAMLRKAIALTGKDEARSNYQIRRAYVDLGRILANSGRTDESEVYLTKARELQNKTMELTQQSISAIALAGGAGSAAAVMPISPNTETEAAPLMAGSADPFAPADAAIVARSNLTAEQRAVAQAQEARLRAVLGLGFNDLATSEAVQKNYAAALGHYQEAEKWDAAIDGLQRNLGVCAFRTQNYSEAIRGLHAALEKNANDAPVRGMLGLAYFGTDQFSHAVKTFVPLGLRGEQDGAIGYAWAASLARLGDLQQAAAVLAEFEKSAASNDTLMLAGQLWLDVGDYPRASATFHRVLAADPAFPKAHSLAGQADIHAEKWAEAAAEFQAELAISSGDLEAQFHLGFVYLQQSKTAEAQQMFEQVVAVNPEHANAQYELGKMLLTSGDVPGAIAHLEIAARVSPQTDYIHYQLQSAYRKASRDADADRELNIYKELKAQKREKAAAQIPM